MVFLYLILFLLVCSFCVVLTSYVRKKNSYTYLDAVCKRRGKQGSFFNHYLAFMLDRAAFSLVIYRINFFQGNAVIGRLLTNSTHFLTGVEIYHNAKIGRHVQIWHGQGTVIGQNSEVGDGCLLLHQVTLGSGKVILGKNVKIGCGAKLLGNIQIGDGSVISANAVVNYDTECNTLVKTDGTNKKLPSNKNIIFGTKKDA